MNKYQRGKIYKIHADEIDAIYIGSTTLEKLFHRLREHVYGYMKWANDGEKYISSYEILAFPSARITLMENFPCENKEELFFRERYHIENNVCVNKLLPITTLEEKIERRKKYDFDHREEISEQRRKYVLEHQDELREKGKEYRAENSEKIKKYMNQWRSENKNEISQYNNKYHIDHLDEIHEKKQKYRIENIDKLNRANLLYKSTHREEANQYNLKYYADNKEELKRKRNIPIVCECGADTTKGGIGGHRKTKLHLANMAKIAG